MRSKRNNDHLDLKNIDITSSTCYAFSSREPSEGKNSSPVVKRSRPGESTIDNQQLSKRVLLVLGDSKGSLHFADVLSSRVVQELPHAHSGIVSQLAFAEKAGVLLSVGSPSDLRPPENIAFSQRVVKLAQSEIRREAEKDRNISNSEGVGFQNIKELGQSSNSAVSGGGITGGSPAPSSGGGGVAGKSVGISDIKIWRVQEDASGLLTPQSLSSLPIFDGLYTAPVHVMCFAVLPDVSQIAVGLENGAVLVLRGDPLRKPEAVRRLLLQPAGPSPVNTIAFSLYEEKDAARLLMQKAGSGSSSRRGKSRSRLDVANDGTHCVGLFVATEDRLVSYPNLHLTRDSDNSLIKGVILDQQGCAPDCMSVDPQGNVVVGREEGVFVYSPHERGPCYVFDGPKVHISWCGRYMIVVSNKTGSRMQMYDLAHKFVASTVSLRGSLQMNAVDKGGKAKEGARNSMNRLSSKKNIWSGAAVMAAAMEAGGVGGMSAANSARLNAAMRGDGEVMHVVSHSTGKDDGTLSGDARVFIITTTHRVYALEEKPFDKRLNELYQKHLYNLALRVVGSLNEAETGPHPSSIHKRHADHLYNKGDFEGSIIEYAQTIGYLDSSVVIRKFLDGQRIPNLTAYLEAYHQYVKAHSNDSVDAPGSTVAKLMPEHTTLLIHCYTKQHRGEALHRFLGLDRASNSIESGFNVDAAIHALREAGYGDEALELSRRNGDHPTYLQILLEDAEGQSDTTEKVQEALSYIRDLPFFEAETTLLAHAHKLVTRAPHETTSLLMELCTPSVDRENQELFSNPEAFLPVYVEYSEQQRRFVHHEELRRFLWHVAQNGSGTVKIFNTLLELCLHGTTADNMHLENAHGRNLSSGSKITSSIGMKGTLTDAGSETMKVLKDTSAKYDPDHALMLVQRHKFSAGILYLYEKRKMYNMIVQHYMDEGDDRALLAAGRKYGERDPNVWTQILCHYASMGERTPECEPFIIQALQHVASQQTISPMNVINILSKNKYITLAVTREYLMEHCRSMAHATLEAEEEAAMTNKDTAELKTRVDSLTDSGLEFQNTRDHLFEHQALNVPSIHFMSGHSYNLDSLTRQEDGELECPISGIDHKRILHSAGQLRLRGTDSEGFFRDLSHASAQSMGMQCIAEQFGRGLFSVPNGLINRDTQAKQNVVQEQPTAGNPFI